MADGLHRRQGLVRPREKQDIESGLQEDDDLDDDFDDDDESDAHEGYGTSRCGRIVTSCIRNSVLRGKVIQTERQCGSLIRKGQETIRATALCGVSLATLSRFYSVCRLYFAESEEATRSSTTEIMEPEVEAPHESAGDPQALQSSRALHIAESIRMYPSQDLKTVPEHTIMSSPVASKGNRKTNSGGMQNGQKEHHERSSALPMLHLKSASSHPASSSGEEKFLDIQKTPQSGESTETPNLFDYSKSSAPLPKLSPKTLGKIAPPVTNKEYEQDLNVDEEIFLEDGADDEKMFDIRQTDARVEFLLRVPKSKTLRNSTSGRKTADIVTMALTRTSSGRFARKTPNQKMNFRRRSTSIGSEGTDITPRGGFVAPFPRPLSRENSNERLDLLLQETSQQQPNEKFYSPLGSPPNLDQFGSSTSENGVLSSGKTPRRGSFVAGSKIERYDRNGSKKQVRRQSTSSGTESSRDYQNSSNGESRKQGLDDSNSSHKPRTERARRRGSFVAGSKIEYYDGHGGRQQSRGASMSSNDTDDSIRYTGYNVEPKKPAPDAELQGKASRKVGRKVSRRGSFVAGSKIERFDGSGRRHRASSGDGSFAEWQMDLIAKG